MHDRTKTEVRVAQAAAKSNSSLLIALQTSQFPSVQHLDIRTAELIVL